MCGTPNVAKVGTSGYSKKIVVIGQYPFAEKIVFLNNLSKKEVKIGTYLTSKFIGLKKD